MLHRFFGSPNCGNCAASVWTAAEKVSFTGDWCRDMTVWAADGRTDGPKGRNKRCRPTDQLVDYLIGSNKDADQALLARHLFARCR